MKYFLLGLALSLLLISACQAPESNPDQEVETKESPNPLSGLWKLRVMERYDSTAGQWQNFRNGMQGYLLYDAAGHMAVHLSTKGYQNFLPEFPSFEEQIPLAALQHITNSYHYLGDYELDQENLVVTHRRLAASNPKAWGEEVRRKYDLRGDTLVLRPEERQNSNLRLTWIRAEE